MTFPYIPLEATQWKMAMGLRPLTLDQWLEPDDARDEELAYKKELITTARDIVIVDSPSAGPAIEELQTEVAQWFQSHHPELALPRASHSPLVDTALSAQEDFCVLELSDTWRLTAAAVCFPSRWDLPSKVGATVSGIHSPVPLYDDTLASPVDAFFSRLTPEKSFWRLNWTLIDNPDLHQPRVLRRAPSGRFENWFFRVERQTLRKLPRTNAIIFTIRNYVANAGELAGQDPEFAERLLRNIETSPESVKKYKGWHGVAEALRHDVSRRGDTL